MLPTIKHLVATGQKSIPLICDTNRCMIRLAEYRFIFKKIDINGFAQNTAFEAQKLRQISKLRVTK